MVRQGKRNGGAGKRSAPPHTASKALRLPSLLITVFIFAVLSFTYFFGPTARGWQQLEILATVLRFNLRGQQRLDPSIRIVGITEQNIGTLAKYGEQYPFARDIHALMLRRIADSGARLIVVDILFAEEGSWDPAEDAALRDAIAYCAEHDCSVVVANGIDVQQTPGGRAVSLVAPADSIQPKQELPYCGFSWGVSNTEQKLGYRLREKVEFARDLEQKLGWGPFSLPVSAYGAYRCQLDSYDYMRAIWALLGNKRLGPERVADSYTINYACQADHYSGVVYGMEPFLPEMFDQVGWDSITAIRNKLKGAAQAGIKLKVDADWTNAASRAKASGALRGNSGRGPVVFYGSRCAADNDYFNTPFGVMFGVDTLAESFDTLLRQRFIHQVPVAVQLLLGLLLTLAAWAIGLLRPIRNAVFAGVLTLLAIAAFDVVLFLLQFDQPLAYTAATFALPFLACTIYGGSVEESERRKIRATFGRYMSDELVAQLVEDPKLADLGGQRLDVAVMFCDIRNYSTLTEHLEPHWTVLMLNIFLGAMTQVIRRHGGFIDKYMGDGLLVCFGGPVPLANPAQASVAAALEMVKVLYEEVHPRLLQDNLPPLRVGIGIHFGPVVMGNIGSESRMDFTVVGDSVNVAARVETATKDSGWAVLVTREVVETSPDFQFELVGEQQVKGRVQGVELYRPIDEELGDRLKLQG